LRVCARGFIYDEAAGIELYSTPGKTGVYAIRPWSAVGYGVLFRITLDYHELGSLAPKSYLFAVVTPGKHIFRVVNADFDTDTPFTTEAGKNYFFTFKPGWGLLIYQIPETDGKKYVRKFKLSGDYQFDK
jgi:hypothetical protein